MARRSKCMVSGVLVATLGAAVASPAGATPPANAPRPAMPSRIDARDLHPSPIADSRTGGRFAVVSQAPLTTEIVSLAISGNGRVIVVADRNGALALVDAATGEVRSARSLLPQPAHEINLEIDDEGRRALVLLRSRDPNVAHELFAWDLVTDDLSRVLVSRSPEITAASFALAASTGEMLYVDTGADGTRTPSVIRADARMRGQRPLPGGDHAVDAVGFTPGLGLPYLIDRADEQAVHLFAGTGELRVDARPPAGPQRSASVVFRPTGGQIAVLEGDGRLALCSPIDGRCGERVQWQGHTPSVVAYGLGGDCITLADAGGAQALVDARTGDIVANLAPGRRAELVRGACTEALISAPGGRLERVPVTRGATSLGRADAPAVPGIDPRDANVPVSRTAVDARGDRVVFALGRSIVIHDVASGESRARALVGTPGVVTDVAWSRAGDQLYVRRDGEVLRAGGESLEVVACEGDGPGRALADGSMSFAGALGCSLHPTRASADLQGNDVVATGADGAPVIGFSANGFVTLGGSAPRPLWPAAELGCAPEACRPTALVASNGALALLRAGAKARLVELATGRRIAQIDLPADASVAFTNDHASVLLAGAARGLDAIDVRTGQVRGVLTDRRVLLGSGSEVSGYVVLGAEGQPFEVHDLRGRGAVQIESEDAAFDRVGTLTPLRGGLFQVTTPRQVYVLDVENRRAIPIDGRLLDAVRVGPAVTVAVCKDETMSVLSLAGSAAPRRLGQMGGCSRIRRAALRDDGSAVAVAAGDAAIVVQTPGERPPLLLRSQQDAEGRSHAVAWVFGRGFSADDAIVGQLRLRRAGQIASAPIEPAAADSLRGPNVHSDYFTRPAPAAPATPATPSRRRRH